MSIKITALKPSQESVGVILNFLSKSEPFASHSLKAISGAVRVQLGTENHLVALDQDKIVGYAGWMRVTSENANAWLRKEAQLVQSREPEADAGALTIFVSPHKAITRLLIKGARDRNRGVSFVFRRDYKESNKPTRRRMLQNPIRTDSRM
jgi:hypothetical protein